MKQDIRFKGLNLALDEQAVENGALAVCDGMEMHNGALRPCVIEGEKMTAEIDGEILYIHELTNGRKNAIFADGSGNLYYQDLSSTESQPLDSKDEALTRSIINSVTSNGNTLVMLTTNGMKYFRWYENTYKYLGKMPELELEFYLRESDTMMEDLIDSSPSPSENQDYFKKAGELIPDRNHYEVEASDEDFTKKESLFMREEAMEAALGRLKTKCKKKGYFSLPFFVRYCYRLWDGRKVMHSAPVLLFSDITYPELVCSVHYSHGDIDRVLVCPVLMMQKLYFVVRSSTVVLDTIKNDWNDVIKSIDVYVTPEISRRDETVTVDIPEHGDYPDEGKWQRAFYTQGTDLAQSVIATRSAVSTIASINSYAITEKMHMDFVSGAWRWANEHYLRGGRGYGVFSPAQLDDERWKKRLIEQNAYYLLHRFDLMNDKKESTPTSGEFPIGNGVLENIEAREQMITSTAPDDYRTHNEIIAKTSYVYNNRINLTEIEEIPFDGFHIFCMIPDFQDNTLGNKRLDRIIVRLDDNGNNIYVEKPYGNNTYVSEWYVQNGFIFFPDTRAKEMWICGRGDNQQPIALAHFKLEEHPLLNGAYHMGDITVDSINTPATDPPEGVPSSITENPRLHLPNYIFTSASGNPFVFPAAHRYAVGLGSVLAIASTTRALSQGQFGQYPLIAFATDGIYALEISSTGSYSGIQSISREVITNPRSLLQLDQSIAFVTRRAVNQLVSSDVTSLSDMLNGALRDLSEMLKDREGETVIPSTGQVADLIGAMQDAQGIYDFVNSRLLYFLKDGDAFTGDVLVFCANDGAWAYKSLGEDIIKGIYNSYPYPYIHKTDGSIECLSVPYDNMEEGSYSGVVVTRTLKTEGVRNAIREFFQDYDFGADTDRPTLILWGSNDNRTWHYIGRSNARQMGRLPGRIYRYFRLAVQFDGMKRNDLYHGVQLDIVERFTR